MSTSEPLEADDRAVGRNGSAPLRVAAQHAADGDRAAQLDRRALADRSRRHHDLPRRADGRRGDDGGQRRQRLAIRRRARGHHPGPSGCRPRHRGRRAHGGRHAHGTAGIADVRAYTKEESAQLVEPWLGNGLALDELPMPRMIVVKLGSGATPDFAALRKTLAAQVPSAILDDHRGWIDRMRTMAGRRSRRRRDPGAGHRRHRAFGHFRDARRHGDQPADRRSAALCRRDRRLCRPPIPAPFPHAWFQGRRHRRRRRDRAVRLLGAINAWFSGTPAATRPRLCSAASPSALPAIWPSSRRSC